MMQPIGTTSRRLKRMVMSFELFRSLFTQGLHASRYNVTGDPIPDDAMLVNVQHGWPNCMDLLVWSESFEEVKDGDLLPILNPICETSPL